MLWFLLFVLYWKMYLQHPALNTSRHSHHRALRHMSQQAAHQNRVCGHWKAILCPEALPSPWHCRARTNTSHVNQMPSWTPSHTVGWPHTAISRPARLLELSNCSGCYTPQGHDQQKMTKILKNTEVLIKPLSFLFFFFFKLEHILHGKEGEPPLGFGVGSIKKNFFLVFFLAYCKAS